MPVLEAEFIFQRYYTVTIAERPIDEYMDRVQAENKARKAFERAMFKRMFQAIVSNQNFLHDICVYQVLAEQESAGGESYTPGYYGEGKDFAQILAKHASCFTPQDRAWLLDLIQRYQHTQEQIAPGIGDYPISDLFDLDVQVEALQQAFHVEPSGFQVGQHACRLKE